MGQLRPLTNRKSGSVFPYQRSEVAALLGDRTFVAGTDHYLLIEAPDEQSCPVIGLSQPVTK